MRRKLWCLLPLLVAGCATDDLGPPPPVERLYVGSHCGWEKTEPQASWIGQPEEFRKVYQRLRAHSGDVPPAVSFSTSGVLLIEMGRKPTGGYGVDLDRPELALDSGQATVRVLWQSPPRNALTTQVITSPCLLLKLPKAGYSLVEVVDPQGQVLLRTSASSETVRFPDAPPRLEKPGWKLPFKLPWE